MKPFFLTVFISCLLLCFSCNRIKKKGEELADTATAVGKELLDTALQEGKNRARYAIDEIFPRFDSYTPDTKYNKERFTEFLNVPLTPDVKNIYAYNGSMGIDANYQFAFHCDTSTARKIIAVHQLKADTVQSSAGFFSEFPWWEAEKVNKLPCWTYEGEHQYFEHFWYDKSEGKAYYSTYDM